MYLQGRLRFMIFHSKKTDDAAKIGVSIARCKMSLTRSTFEIARLLAYDSFSTSACIYRYR